MSSCWSLEAQSQRANTAVMKWTQLPDKEQLQGKHKAASEQLQPQITNQMGFQGLQDQHELEIYSGV